ncbi:hypothetical protein BD626DRAFT_498193 [Schizophyllum amplum]|uniref:DUF6699 domain-containing protein n=1 Tax=Schizophyllum amplum TaxID=97359 RepID=A0A550CD20_9AGAR|nr:hypothetical protein BD626DRAFT_498193 [Auriculariopsis ampla]
MGLWAHLLRVISSVHGRLAPATTKEESIHVIDNSPLKQVRIVEHYNEYYSPRVTEKTPSPAFTVTPLPSQAASTSTPPTASARMPTNNVTNAPESMMSPPTVPSSSSAPRPRKRKRSNSAQVHKLLALGSPLHFNMRSQRPSITTSRGHGELSMKLRCGVTSDEYYGLPSREERDADEERKKGIKRVDFLTTHYRFRGLDYSHQGAGVFTLHVQVR